MHPSHLYRVIKNQQFKNKLGVRGSHQANTSKVLEVEHQQQRLPLRNPVIIGDIEFTY